MEYKCELCGKIYHRAPAHENRSKHHYCSKECAGIAKRIKPQVNKNEFEFWSNKLNEFLQKTSSILFEKYEHVFSYDEIYQLGLINLYRNIDMAKKRNVSVDCYTYGSLRISMIKELNRELLQMKKCHYNNDITQGQEIYTTDFSEWLENKDYYRCLYRKLEQVSIYSKARDRERMYFDELLCDFTPEQTARLNGIAIRPYNRFCYAVRQKYQEKYPEIKELLHNA